MVVVVVVVVVVKAVVDALALVLLAGRQSRRWRQSIAGAAEAIEGEIGSVTMDRTYDRGSAYRVIASHQPDPGTWTGDQRPATSGAASQTAMGRYEAIIFPKLRARLLPAQQSEVVMAAQVLNRMIWAAKPVSTRLA